MITILGAGVAGLCAASALAERGLSVQVADIGPEGMGASWLAGWLGLGPFVGGESAEHYAIRVDDRVSPHPRRRQCRDHRAAKAPAPHYQRLRRRDPHLANRWGAPQGISTWHHHPATVRPRSSLRWVVDAADSFGVTYTQSGVCLAAGGPSYRAVFPDFPAQAESCANAGVMEPAVAALGSARCRCPHRPCWRRHH